MYCSVAYSSLVDTVIKHKSHFSFTHGKQHKRFKLQTNNKRRKTSILLQSLTMKNEPHFSFTLSKQHRRFKMQTNNNKRKASIPLQPLMMKNLLNFSFTLRKQHKRLNLHTSKKREQKHIDSGKTFDNVLLCRLYFLTDAMLLNMVFSFHPLGKEYKGSK